MSAGKFYSIEDIEGALVVDAEGLVYGKVGGYFIEAGKAYLKVYVEYKSKRRCIDVEKLREELLRKNIRLPPEAPLEVLILRAREEGIEVPYKVLEKDVRMLKGFVPVEEIQWIDTETVEDEEIRVVLLKTPREARFRGLSPQEKVPLVGEEYFRDKLVISLEKGILGYAGCLVFGGGEVGLRVYKHRGIRGYVNWLKFIMKLRQQGYTDLAEKLSEKLDPYKNSRIPITMLDQVKQWLAELKAPESLANSLKEEVIYERERSVYTDVPWKNIVKLREVVIVK